MSIGDQNAQITGYKIKDDRKFLGTFIMSFNASPLQVWLSLPLY